MVTRKSGRRRRWLPLVLGLLICSLSLWALPGRRAAATTAEDVPPPADDADRQVPAWQGEAAWLAQFEADAPPPPHQLPAYATSLPSLAPKGVETVTALPDGEGESAVVSTAGAAVLFSEQRIMLVLDSRTYDVAARLTLTRLPVPVTVDAGGDPWLSSRGEVLGVAGAWQEWGRYRLEVTDAHSGDALPPPARPIHWAFDVRAPATDVTWVVGFIHEAAPARQARYPVRVHHADGLISAAAARTGVVVIGRVTLPEAWRFSWQPPVVSRFSGAATYALPLSLPAGRHGLQPDLTLRYNSRAVDGLVLSPADQGPLGLGWSLGEVAISRSGVRLGSTAGPRGPVFSVRHYPEFSLTLHGQQHRLRRQSAVGVPAGDGTERTTYMAVNGPGLQVEQVYDPALTGGNRDRLYWLVRTPDGTTYRLGYTADATRGQWQGTALGEYLEVGAQPSDLDREQHGGHTLGWGGLAWTVDTVTDVQGNQVQTDYFRVTRESEWHGSRLRTELNRPRQIRYNNVVPATGPDRVPGEMPAAFATRIDFEIEDGSPYRVMALSVYHLDAVQAASRVTFGLRTIGFSPDCSGQLLHTDVLDSVQVWGYAARGAVSLPATTFTYDEAGFPHHHGCYRHVYLTGVDNGYGGRVAFDYVSDGLSAGAGPGQLPQHGTSYYVRAVTQAGGVAPATGTTYAYSEPCYDKQAPSPGKPACPTRPETALPPLHGVLVGFAQVTGTVRADAGAGPPLQISASRFHTATHLAGRPAWRTVADAAGRPISRQTFTYGRDVSDDDGDGLLDVDFTFEQTACRQAMVPGGGDPPGAGGAVRCVTHTYGRQQGRQVGNLTMITEVIGQGVTRVTRRSYVPNVDDWVVQAVAREQVFQESGGESRLVAERRHIYDDNTVWTQAPDRGRLRQVVQLQDSGVQAAPAPAPAPGPCRPPRCTSLAPPGATAVTAGNAAEYPTYVVVETREYNHPFGLVTAVSDGLGHTVTTEYDPVYALAPVAVTNPLGQQETFAYYHLNEESSGLLAAYPEQAGPPGALAQATDANGGTTYLTYDPFGRLHKLFRGWEAQGSDWRRPSEIHLVFDHAPYNLLDRGPLLVASWRKTQDQAAQWSAGGIWERRFFDGFGRLVQEQRPHTDWVLAGQVGSGHRVVTDFRYDALGRQIAQSDPALRAAFDAGHPLYLSPGLASRWQTTAFDAAGRVVQARGLDGAVQSRAYGLDAAYAQDGNGHLRASFYDAAGRLAAVDEPLATFSAGFEDGSLAGWRHSGLVDVSGGAARLRGDGSWRTYLGRDLEGAGQAGGVALSFRADGEQTRAALFIERGGFGAAGYRRWGLELRDGMVRFVPYGAGGREDATPLMPFQARRWYRLLLRADWTTGDFILVVWPADDPAQAAEVRLPQPADWWDQQWAFIAQVRTAAGVLLLDEYEELTFWRTRYAHDVMGRLMRITDALGNETTIGYDALGRQKTMLDPDLGRWFYEYDAAGNLVTQIDGRGQAIALTYDALNRLVTRRLGPGGPLLARYRYDETAGGNAGLGRRTGMVAYDPPGVVHNSASWRYDQAGRMVAEERQVAGQRYTFHFGYTQGDLPVTLTYPDGERVTTHYWWQTGQARSLVGDSWLVGTGNAPGVTYTAAGRPETVRLGNGQTGEYRYDAAHRLTSLAHSSGRQQLELAYDEAGNVVQLVDRAVADMFGVPFVQRFGYDSLDRLATATGAGGRIPAYTAEMAYDPLGNLSWKNGACFGYGAGAGCGYAPGGRTRPHALTHINGQERFRYDAVGNMIWRRDEHGRQWALSWSADNRLQAASDGAGTQVRLVYDADGALIQRLVGGQSTFMLGRLYQVRSGAVVKHYELNGNLVAVRDAAGLGFLLRDHLGSTVTTLWAGGGLRADRRTDPWGQVLWEQAQTPTGYRYTGQRWDASLGLYDYRARYYDPATGRFISADTVAPNPASPQGLNRYAYVHNNPLGYTDPSGHDRCGTAGAVCLDIPPALPGGGDTPPPPVDVADAYTDWYYSPVYSGCFRCHAAVANGQIILTDSQLAAVDRQMRQAALDGARAVEPIDYAVQVLDCLDGCDPETTLWMMAPGLSGGMVDDFYRITGHFDDLVSARGVRYTQDSLSAATRDGLHLDDLMGSMATYGWRGAALRVVEVDGVLYSLDHRRLVAAQQLGINVPVSILDLSNPAVAAEFARKSAGLRAGTQGLYIDIRGLDIRFYTDGRILFPE